MTTECKQESFGFHPLFRRQVRVGFDGGNISSDGGGLLLREVEKRTGIIAQFAYCFQDGRNGDVIEHTVEELVGQRVYGLALGYEDLNDHQQLRQDPLLAVLVGKRDPMGEDRVRVRDRGKALAGKSTLNRLELTGTKTKKRKGKGTGAGEAEKGEETRVPEREPGPQEPERYKKISLDFAAVDRLLVDIFLDSFAEERKEMVLDLDSTDDPLHGNQEGRFFHGYYGHYCYLPLYIVCGEHVLCARLRSSNIDGAAGCVEELKRMVQQIRVRWPKVRIIIRGDSGFCRNELMSWCEEEKEKAVKKGLGAVDFCLGLARNSRLEAEIESALQEAKGQFHKSGKAARVYGEFFYQTRESWDQERRVIAKAEHLEKGANPRFVVTSLSAEEWPAERLYEKLYCARGDMENRIKEQLMLFADRTSTAYLHSNQVRLYFSTIAYLLLQALRRLGLQGTELAQAQCNSIRLKLLKIGAAIRVTVRKVWISLSESCPYAAVFHRVWQQLQAVPLRS
jgi:hypothetical protein